MFCETCFYMLISILDYLFFRNAMIRSKSFTFETLLDASYSPKVALLSEVQYSNFPMEIDEDESTEDFEFETEHSRDFRELRSIESSGDLKEHRAAVQADSGESIDVLCLYTAQALQARCSASKGKKGKKCSDPNNYLNYVEIMNEKCQLAAHQTVSRRTYKVEKKEYTRKCK